MNVNRLLFAIFGFFVIFSALLGYFHSKYWLFLTMIAGFNAFQYTFTGFCPMGTVLRKLGVPDKATAAGVETDCGCGG